MQFFKNETTDNVVVMGRRTYDSLGGCLPHRTNVVVTHGFALFPEGPECKSAHSIAEALTFASKAAGKRREVFVIGGATMYEQFARYVDRYLITVVEKDVSEADTFFSEKLLGDGDQWDRRVLKTGLANSSGDEANFTILEYVAKNRIEIARGRDDAIERVKAHARQPYTSFEIRAAG